MGGLIQCNNNLPSHKYVHRFHYHTVNGFIAIWCCCSFSRFLYDKIASFIGRIQLLWRWVGNGPPYITSESSWLEPLLCAELRADQRRRVRCRLPSGFVFGQQAPYRPLSPLWLPLLVWSLYRGQSLNTLGQHISVGNIDGLEYIMFSHWDQIFVLLSLKCRLLCMSLSFYALYNWQLSNNHTFVSASLKQSGPLCSTSKGVLFPEFHKHLIFQLANVQKLQHIMQICTFSECHSRTSGFPIHSFICVSWQKCPHASFQFSISWRSSLSLMGTIFFLPHYDT